MFNESFYTKFQCSMNKIDESPIYHGMKNHFLSHLPKGKWNKKFTHPNFYFPVEAHDASQIYLESYLDMPPNENFEIFNAKSCILSITEKVLMFKINWFFLLCFVVYNQFEIWIWIKLHFCWFVIIIFDSLDLFFSF